MHITWTKMPFVSYFNGLHIAPLRLLPNLLLHVVVGLCLFGAHTGSLVPTEVARWVSLVDLWTPLLINRYQYHTWEGGREQAREGEKTREVDRGETLGIPLQ